MSKIKYQEIRSYQIPVGQVFKGVFRGDESTFFRFHKGIVDLQDANNVCMNLGDDDGYELITHYEPVPCADIFSRTD